MKDRIKNLLSIHWILTITIATIAVLQFTIFGVVGLVTYFLLLIYNLIGLIYCWRIEKKRVYICPTFILGIAYCGFYIISSLVNGNYKNITSTILQYLLILILAFYIRTDSFIINDVLSISKVLTVAGIVMSVISVVLAILGTAFPDFFFSLPNFQVFDEIRIKICDITKERLIGFAGNPNTTALYCYVCIIASIFLTSVAKQAIWKYFSVLNILVSGSVIILLSRSRTNILSLVAFACSFLFVYYLIVYKADPIKRKTFKLILISVFVLCLLAFIVIFLSPAFRSFIFNDILRIDSVKNIGNREFIFEAAIEMGSGNRLFGINSDIFEDSIAPHTHNMYLEVITFAGVPCFILFISYLLAATGIVILNFKKLHNASVEAKVLNCFCFSFLLGYFIGGLTEPGGVSSMRLIFPVLQVLIASACVMHYNAGLKSATEL